MALLHGNNSRERVPNTNPPDDLKKAIGENYGPLADSAWAVYSSTPTDASNGTAADQWANDVSFRCPAVAQVAWHSAAGNSTYEYEFARVPAGRESEGATHASELAYVFGTLDRGLPSGGGRPSPQRFSRAYRRAGLEQLQQYSDKLPPRRATPTAASFRDGRNSTPRHAPISVHRRGSRGQGELRRPFCDLFIENVKRSLMGG